MMIVFDPVLSFATPPGDLLLTYDLEKGTITAQGPHPTQEPTEHYIRRFEISRNNEAPKTFYFPKQRSAPEFKETVAFDFKPGDFIYVKVSCSQGGSKELGLQIPEENTAMDLKALKDQDHQNMQVVP